jgi:hypothetical protein
MPINVGGDDSVIWKVKVRRAKHAVSDPDHAGNPKDYYHEGVEETNDHEAFEVTIKLPDGDPFPILSNCPSASAKSIGGRHFVTFSLPIEKQNGLRGKGAKDPDQISIDWK